MTEEKCSVVFSGKLAEGEKIETVKKRLAALFKIPAQKVDALFKQERVTLQENLDLKSAQKYIRIIGNAGAVCRIEPMTPKDPSPEPAAPPPEKKAKKKGPRVVTVKLAEAQLGFSPFLIKKITGTPDGLNFNKMGIPETLFEQITAVAVISETEGSNETNKLILFVASSKRPFICEARNIVYTDFPIDTEASTMITLRHFLAFLCDQNPSIILEESTSGFLAGRPPKRLGRDEVIKLSTGLGKLMQKS